MSRHSGQRPRPHLLAGLASPFLLLTFFATSIVADDSRPVLTGTVVKVIDADTIDVELKSGAIRIQLHGIDAPERGQPWEDESTAWLKKRVLGKTVDIEPFEHDSYDRLVGIVIVGETNISAELVRLGHAWAYRQYMRKADAALCADEATARLKGVGLWSLPAGAQIAPWEWRRRKTLEDFTDYSRQTTGQCVASLGKKPTPSTTAASR